MDACWRQLEVQMKHTLNDRVALITGASRGLGRALAEQLGKRGVRVVMVARERSALDAARDTLRDMGISAHSISADVGTADPHTIVATAQALVGPIDILINNASSLGPTPLRPLLDTDAEDLRAVLAVNLLGPFMLTKALVGAMALRGHGVVVNVSSDAAVEAYPAWGAYGSSKAALDHLTRIWAAELDASGVRVFGVDPGEMDTQMHADAIPDADRTTLAKPRDVASRIVELIADAELAPNGVRLSA
jgi:NAD(P)-dependent dehydrogenase (short-subunit alcohol dehydrogenase family)